LHTLSNLFLIQGIPGNIRSDNDHEFTARAVRRWLERMGVKTAFIENWRKGYNTARQHGSLGCRPPATEGGSTFDL
jgi:transposase InsO family protein